MKHIVPSNLDKITMYLAGPIKGCTDSETFEWRQYVTFAVSPFAVTILNPALRDYRAILENETDLNNLSSLDE